MNDIFFFNFVFFQRIFQGIQWGLVSRHTSYVVLEDRDYYFRNPNAENMETVDINKRLEQVIKGRNNSHPFFSPFLFFFSLSFFSLAEKMETVDINKRLQTVTISFLSQRKKKNKKKKENRSSFSL